MWRVGGGRHAEQGPTARSTTPIATRRNTYHVHMVGPSGVVQGRRPKHYCISDVDCGTQDQQTLRQVLRACCTHAHAHTYNIPHTHARGHTHIHDSRAHTQQARGPAHNYSREGKGVWGALLEKACAPAPPQPCPARRQRSPESRSNKRYAAWTDPTCGPSRPG